MEILYILAFIALVAVIFGVSMHEAFWGIIAFIVGCFILSVIALFAGAFATRTKKKINYLKSPRGKAEIKDKIKWRMLLLCVWIIILSPWAVAILLAVCLPDITPEWLLNILAFLPFVIGFGGFIIEAKRSIKKNANRKN